MTLLQPFLEEIIVVSAVLLSMAIVVSLAEWWLHRFHPPVEWTRKVVHVWCGAIAAVFPWILSSAWSVAFIALVFEALFVVARTNHWLRCLYAVERRSLGEFYFVISVLILFIVAHDTPVFYLISVLTLTVADALAALMGKTYKKLTYSVEAESKSAEGSATFFVCTFLIAHLLLLMLTDVDKTMCVVMSAEIALVLTCLEAICLEGFDNFVIPIATYLCLVKMSAHHTSTQAFELLALVLIIACIHVAAWRIKFLSVSGAISAQMFFFAAYALGGPTWMVPAVITAAAFALLYAILHARPQVKPRPTGYAVRAVFYFTLVAQLLVFGYNFSQWLIPSYSHWEPSSPFYVLYVGVLAAQLAVALFRLLWLHTREVAIHTPVWWVLPFLACLSYILIVPFGLWVHKGDVLWGDLLVSALIGLGGPWIYHYAFWYWRWPRRTPWEFRLQATSVGIAVLLTMPLYGWMLEL